MRKNLLGILYTLFWVNLSFAQSLVVGFIKDKEGLPIAGVNVIIKGSGAHAVSDDNGRFSIKTGKTLPFTLRASSVGYKASEVPVSQLDELLITLLKENHLNEIVVTSRRRSEVVQDIPIPISVVGRGLVEDAGAFNVNRVKELVPSVQLYSSNPRNTTLNIRGVGSTFGLTNDGIDPGVGFYVDGVYFARPAATALDFVDIERIEVLRGPQGTLFGKNTTAGAFNITTRGPSFKPGANFEVSYGNFGYVQAKASVTAPLTKKIAGRISFSGTQRDGILQNIATDRSVNDINNLGFRGQLLYLPNNRFKINLTGDASRQRPDGYAQVVAGVVKTNRAAYRQFDAIIADLGYSLASTNPFDRKIDHNTTWKSGNDLGGVSLNVEAKLGQGTLTSTSAWRYWNWDPSNDRDFTGLSVLQLSQATSKHQQWTQEVRYTGAITSSISAVLGVFAIGQDLKTDPFHIEESGSAQWRFSQSTTSELWKTPGLFDGYGIKTNSRLKSFGGAIFGQIEWAITDRLHVLPGLRYNYDKKDVNFDRKTYGGLQTTDPQLLALKRLVYTDQAFTTEVDESNVSGQITASYKASEKINTFATFSTSYKPVGVNLGGLPTSNGTVMIELARIKPETVKHYEVGVKTSPNKQSTFNVVLHNTEIKDYQTNVQSPEPGVNRGYLANAEKVRVRGVEVDGNTRLLKNLSLYGSVAFTEGKYVKFTNAPVPLEETGSASAFKDVSGGDLPGISKWAGSVGAEFVSNQFKLFGKEEKFFIAADSYSRSSFSSSPSPSAYLNVKGYTLINGRIGFRSSGNSSVFVWGRNLLDKNYYEQLLPAAGNAGHYAGVLGDQRTFGITLRYAF